MPPPTSERRRIRRQRTRLPIVFRESGSGWREAMVGDVSDGGLWVISRRPPTPGTALTLEVTTDQGSLLHLRGVVTWSRDTHRSMARHVHGGFGVKLNWIPGAWGSFVASC